MPDPTTFSFPASSLPPLALGFFGLGVGYFIYGPQELFGFPRRDPGVDRTTGLWGIFMPGAMQLVTGIILWVGITWFQVFRGDPLLYMAALAFTAYGIHWFAIGGGRYTGSDPRPNSFMAIAFAIISVLGLLVFFLGGDWPVGVLFCGLTAVYLSDIFASLRITVGERLLGVSHLLTGMWLMYLMFAVTVNFTLHYSWPV